MHHVLPSIACPIQVSCIHKDEFLSQLCFNFGVVETLPAQDVCAKLAFTDSLAQQLHITAAPVENSQHPIPSEQVQAGAGSDLTDSLANVDEALSEHTREQEEEDDEAYRAEQRRMQWGEDCKHEGQQHFVEQFQSPCATDEYIYSGLEIEAEEEDT